MKRIVLVMCAAAICSTALAQSHRLINAATYMHNGTAMQKDDTAYFVYLPGNKNNGTPDDFDGQTLLSDTNSLFRYDNGVPAKYVRYIKHFTAAGLPDTVWQQTGLGGTNTWDKAALSVYEYNKDGNQTYNMLCAWRPLEADYDTSVFNYFTYTGTQIQEQVTDARNGDSTRINYTYSGTNLTEVLISNNAGGTWHAYNKTNYSYDAGNNVDTISTYTLAPSGTGLIDDTRQVMTYSGKQLTSTTFYSWHDLPAMWMPNVYTKYLYDAAGHKTTDSLLNWNENTNTFDPLFVYRHSYNAAGLNDTTTRIRYMSGFANNSRTIMEYDAKQALTRKRTETWMTATGTWKEIEFDSDKKYYYEKEPDPSGITNTKPQDVQLLLYPNPAGGVMTINIISSSAQPCVVQVYNTMGALLQQWEETGSNTSRSISTGHLADGQYILSVKGRDGGVVSQQFEVKH